MNRYEIALGKRPRKSKWRKVLDADGKVVAYDGYDLRQKWLKENNEGHAHDQELKHIQAPLASEMAFDFKIDKDKAKMIRRNNG